MVDFTCEVVGEPTPDLRWTYNGQDILDDGNKYAIFDTDGVNHLEVYDVKPEDAGKYVVEAENKFGKATCTASLQVKGMW